MKKVKVTYDDGTEREFESVREASEALSLALTTLPRMASGGNRRLKTLLHISNVEISTHRRNNFGGLRQSKSRCPIRCINRDGTVVEAESITEALKKIGLEGKNISHAIDDGCWHLNGEWRFETIAEKPLYEWREPVSDETAELIYRYAKHCLRRYPDLPPEECREIRQAAAAKVASYVSAHLYRTPRVSKKLMYMWCVDQVSRLAGKYFDRRALTAEPADPELDRDDWLDTVSAREDWTSQTDAMYAEMPEHLIPLARAYEEGLTSIEMRVRFHCNHRQLNELTAELVKWLEDRRAQG